MNPFIRRAALPVTVNRYPEISDRPASIPEDTWDAAHAATADTAATAAVEQVEYGVREIAAHHITVTEYGGFPLADRPPAAPVRSQVHDPFGLASRRERETDMYTDNDPWSRHMRERAERKEKTDALTRTIMGDPARRRDVFWHFLALHEASRMVAAQREAAEIEAQFLAERQCPICHDTDSARTGMVTVRALLPSWKTGGAGVPSVRSCEACWHEMSEQHFAQLASERVRDGNMTRREAVAQHLATMAGSLADL